MLYQQYAICGQTPTLLEREVYDFFGIKFLGHPDMRRLFLRNDFVGYPLRKDYDMDPAKNMYTTEDDIEVDTTTEWNLNADGQLTATTHQLFTNDQFVVNIGPQHPSTHGVLRLQTVLDGEKVEHIYPHLGYIHRGIEKNVRIVHLSTNTRSDRPYELSFGYDAPPRIGRRHRRSNGH